jgi:uroporphyrinogen-III synthase
LEARFKDVRIADGDALSLAALVKRSLPLGTVLLHVAGRERKPEPEASLSGAGFSVASWAAYAAVPAARLPAAAERALREERVDAALHYSRRSAGVLLGLVGSAGVEAPFFALAHICLSDDTAAPLQQAGAKRLSVADRPDEESLLAALDRFALK